MERKIGLDCVYGRSVYMLVRDDIPRGLASIASIAESSLLWHCCLGHPSYRNFQWALPWIIVESFVNEFV